MKNNNKKKSPASIVVIVLAVLAVLLLGFSAFQGTRAALTYYSNDFVTQIGTQDIGITLLENGAAPAEGKLLSNLFADTKDQLLLDHEYKEELAAQNSGTIDQFVRVSVYKRWVDKDGNVIRTMDPDLIQLKFNETDWILDTDKSTTERTVLYYKTPLAAGAASANFLESITIDPSVGTKSETTKTTIKGITYYQTTYEYNGYRFELEVEADAVQTHNAKDAIKSAWGVDLNVDEAKNLSK